MKKKICLFVLVSFMVVTLTGCMEQEMVTWTFDFVAFFAGSLAGIIIGSLIVILIEMRDGGAWSKGFYEGCDLRHKIDDINSAADYAKRSMTGWQSINKQLKDGEQK